MIIIDGTDQNKLELGLIQWSLHHYIDHNVSIIRLDYIPYATYLYPSHGQI